MIVCFAKGPRFTKNKFLKSKISCVREDRQNMQQNAITQIAKKLLNRLSSNLDRQAKGQTNIPILVILIVFSLLVGKDSIIFGKN